MTRPVTTGQNNWLYRTGYKHTPRISGPVQPMDYPRPSIWQRIKGKVSHHV